MKIRTAGTNSFINYTETPKSLNIRDSLKQYTRHP